MVDKVWRILGCDNHKLPAGSQDFGTSSTFSSQQCVAKPVQCLTCFRFWYFYDNIFLPMFRILAMQYPSARFANLNQQPMFHNCQPPCSVYDTCNCVQTIELYLILFGWALSHHQQLINHLTSNHAAGDDQQIIFQAQPLILMSIMSDLLTSSSID